MHSTRAVVLCVGADGHVAIEMAGHKHCHGSESHHDTEMAGHHHCEDDHCSYEAHHTGIAIEEHLTCCGPHEEIPLSPAMADSPCVQKMPETKVLSAGIAMINPDTAELSYGVFVLPRAGPASTSFYDPLSSIILIV